jgi:hypothetical protein
MSARNLFVITVLLCALAITIALYLWELRRSVVPNTPAEISKPVAPPGAGPATQARLWIAYDDPGVLREQKVTLPLPRERQQKAETLLRALVNTYTNKGSPHPLRPEAEVRNVYFLDPGLAVIDLSSALADGQPSGILSEELTVVSIVQTLATNLEGITKIKLLVGGKEHDTLAGHADLTGMYDVSQVAQLAKTLESP